MGERLWRAHHNATRRSPRASGAIALLAGLGVALLVLGCATLSSTTPRLTTRDLVGMADDCQGAQAGTWVLPAGASRAEASEVFALLLYGGSGVPLSAGAGQLFSELALRSSGGPLISDGRRVAEMAACLRSTYGLSIPTRP